MNCPVCNGNTTVIASKPSEDSVHRRRKCLACNYRFNTTEIDDDYYETLKHIDKEAIKKAFLAELKRKTYAALNTEERKI